MGYSKKETYQELIRFLNHEECDIKAFENGFGKLKELLFSLDVPSSWPESSKPYYEQVKSFYEALEKYNDREKSDLINSIKNSTLSSYFTPNEIIEPLCEVLSEKIAMPVERICEPSAGTGNFIPYLEKYFINSSITAIEKDILTARILSKKFPVHEIINQPYEESKIDRFNLIISNIPFGNIGVYDHIIYGSKDPVKILSCSKIHNYFFVKSLDNLKEGGILAFITSSGVMDSGSNQKIREYLMAHSKLIGAYRLPESIFKDSGTLPTTDLIILQKNSNRQKKEWSKKEHSFTQIGILQDNSENPIELNKYYVDNPTKILGEVYLGGQYGQNDVCVRTDKSLLEIGVLLRQSLSEIELITATQKPFIDQAEISTLTSDNVISLPAEFSPSPYERPGNLIVWKSQIGILRNNDDGYFIEKENGKDVDRVLKIIELRNTYKKLIQLELSNDNEIENTRKDLNSLYDLFHWQYGNLQDRINIKYCELDIDSLSIKSLENNFKGRFSKADIFFKRINGLSSEIKEVNNLEDAIILSLNKKGKVDFEFICSSLRRDKFEVMEEALQKEALWFNPYFKSKNGQRTVGFKVVKKEQFCSGNIVEKMEALELGRDLFPKIGKDYYTKHMDLLHEVKPLHVPIESIGLSLGERWIKPEVYERFASHLFNTSCSVVFVPGDDAYYVTSRGYSSLENIDWGVETYTRKFSGSTVLEYTLIDKAPELTKPVLPGSDIKIKDIEGIRNFQNKIEKMKLAWNEFILSDQASRNYLEKEYNRRFNCIAPFRVDGSYLEFSGLKKFTPYWYQKNGVGHAIQFNGGYIDHCVGAGKSLVMASLAMKLRETGMANKVLIVALKVNCGDIAKEFAKAFPSAKILSPSEKDFEKKNRRALLYKVMNNEFDAVLITHEQFGMLQQNKSHVQAMVNLELESIDKFAKESGYLGTRALKGLEKGKARLKNQYKKNEMKILKRYDDALPSFDMLGFDHLMVDEAHEFKNLPFYTRHSGMAGIGNPEGSIKAFNMLVACRAMQQKHGKDSGITFLSGTPVSNSLVELYSIQRYLRPTRLKELELNTFDAWASVYAEISFDFEFTATGEVKRKGRFRSFKKLPELSSEYASMANVLTDNQLKLPDRPVAKNVFLKIPISDTQKDYAQRLIEFVKTKDGASINRVLTEGEKKAIMLMATSFAKKMSIDMRLINSQEYQFEEGGKLDVMAQNISKIYRETGDWKGTQLVFSDIGTPTSGEGRFNLYDELKRILVEKYNIPSQEIAFVHSYPTRASREQLFENVNDGNVRVLFGSTKKLGTGVNVQKRIAALHHMDIPWRPSDMEQRIGRAARQGNEFAMDKLNGTVSNYVYGVENTLDAYLYQLLDSKQKIMRQYKTSALSIRKMMESSMDDDGAMPMAEYVAIISGDNKLLERAKLSKEVAELEANYNAFMAEQSNTKYRSERNKEAFLSVERNISALEKDLEAYQKLNFSDKKEEKRFMYPTPVIVDNMSFNDPKQIGERILEKVKANERKNLPDHLPLCHYGPFVLFREKNDGKIYVQKEGSKLLYAYSERILNENPTLAGKYLYNALEGISNRMESENKRLEKLQEESKAYERVLQKTFDGKDRIKELNERIREIDFELDQREVQSQKVENTKIHAQGISL